MSEDDANPEFVRYDGTLTLIEPLNYDFYFHGNGEELVRLTLDGVVLHPKLEATEAARVFWDAVRTRWRADIEAAILAERGRCAKIADEVAHPGSGVAIGWTEASLRIADRIADRIREAQ